SLSVVYVLLISESSKIHYRMDLRASREAISSPTNLSPRKLIGAEKQPGGLRLRSRFCLATPPAHVASKKAQFDPDQLHRSSHAGIYQRSPPRRVEWRTHVDAELPVISEIESDRQLDLAVRMCGDDLAELWIECKAIVAELGNRVIEIGAVEEIK